MNWPLTLSFACLLGRRLKGVFANCWRLRASGSAGFLSLSVVVLALATADIQAQTISTNISTITPAYGSESNAPLVTNLTQIVVTFIATVTNVAPDDISLNGTIATSVSPTNSAATFTYSFPPITEGLTTAVWNQAHGILRVSNGSRLDELGSSTTWYYNLVDKLPPATATINPVPDATLGQLTQITVLFNEPVANVNASDLLVNGQPAVSVSGAAAGPYVFTVTPPVTPGAVTVSWLGGHGIVDLAAAANAFAGGSWSYTYNPGEAAGDIVINEFLASNVNTNGYRDEDNSLEDWIEIYNRGASPVNLLGWSLTDDADVEDQWVFPNVTITNGQFLVVFASGKNRTPTSGAPLHTNFKLGSSSGQYLALFNANQPADVATRFLPAYPPQRPDISYGLFGSTFVYLTNTTPGAANSGPASFSGFAIEPQASVQSGFFNMPFTVTLSSATPGATIRYTLDGSEPTPTSTLYTGPITVAGSSNRPVASIRATAYQTNLLSSHVVTFSYIFPSAVLQQPAAPAGYPATWVTPSGSTVVPADYEMDPQVLVSSNYAPRALQALTNIPALSIVLDNTALFSQSAGIYANPNPPPAERAAWERSASAELIFPDGSQGFQIDAGLRIQGGTSRDPNRTRKHSFRLFFNSSYDGRLEYKFYEDSSRDRFNSLVLDAASNLVWHNRLDSLAFRGQYIRDAFASDLQTVSGTQCWHSRFVNLFVNGLYWGIYYPHERPDEHFAAAYYGGDNDEYDVVRNTEGALELVNGDLAAWSAMTSLINASISNTNQYAQLLKRMDVDRFIDYMIINMYVGNTDWSQHNWYAFRRRVPLPGPDPGTNFIFQVWDAEWSLINTNDNISGVNQTGTPTGFHSFLRNSTEYRQRFADRLHRLCFNGGPLFVNTNAPAVDPALPQNNRPGATYLRRAAEIDLAIVLESARWGDAKDSQANSPFTRDVEFVNELNRLKNTYFPSRTATLLGQFLTQILYPNPTFGGVTAPTFNQHGGNVPAGFNLTMTAPLGTIYYTTDGTDPRVMFTGAVAPGTLTYSGPVVLNNSVIIKARALNGASWSPLNEATFAVGELLPTVRITELMYNPGGGDAFQFLELKNVGSAAVNLGGYNFTDGISFLFPAFTLQPGTVAVLANPAGSPTAWTNRYGFAPTFYWTSGNLATGGERVELQDIAGRTIISVDYDNTSPWPTNLGGRSIEIIDVNGDPDDPANWRPSGTTNGTPGFPPTAQALPAIRLNEIQAIGGGLGDRIEIINTGVAGTNLFNWSLTDDSNPRKFVFPSGSGSDIGPGGYMLVVGFALDNQGETLALYDAQTNRVDAVTFGLQITNFTVGRINDLWQLNNPTLGSVNVAAAVGSPTVLKINEWMADSAPTQSDWFELYNPGAQPVELRGLYASTSNALFKITSLSFIGAGGYAQLLADEGAGPNHVDFTLPASGGTISILDSSSNVLDSVSYASQTQGISEGRYPDGSATIMAFPGSASPGDPNYLLPTSGPRLNELLARNDGVNTDPWGGSSDFLEIQNAGSSNVNLAGWSLSVGSADPGDWTFPSTNVAAGGRLIVWCDGSRAELNSAGGPFNLGSSLSSDTDSVYLFNAAGQTVDTVQYGFQLANQSIGRDSGGAWKLLATPTPGTANTSAATLGSTTSLRLNEWMANPTSGDDWFELYNTNTLPLDLSGVHLTDDPSISGQAKFTVGPLSFVAGNAWVLYEADNNPGAGPDHVNFSLDSTGETLLIYDTTTTNLIDSVPFGVQLPGESQGRLPDGSTAITNFPASASPGIANYLPLTTIAINEVLSHADTPYEDAIELVNLTGTNVPIGGFYLSDNEQNPKKYRIASGTTIAANGFKVFYQYQFDTNAVGTNYVDPGRIESFAFDSAHGDAAYLSAADGSSNLLGYRASVVFGAAKNGVSFGRFTTNAVTDFVPMSQRTFGQENPSTIHQFRTGTGLTNAYPLVGPVLISELMYHPISNDVNLTEYADDEYIELFNSASTNVVLFDPAHTTNRWRLAGGVDFTFPGGVTLTNKSYLIIVHFDPTNTTARAAFTNKYGIGPGVPLHGPFSGRLSNDGESIELQKPDTPQGPGSDEGFVPYVQVERVEYLPIAPWASAADGGGASLQRIAPANFYNDPQNWKGESPTAGRTNSQATPSPVVTSQPADTVAVTGTPVSLMVQASGADPKFYQWQRNLVNVGGATSNALNFPSAQPSDSGSYRVSVSNSAGFVWSQTATLTVATPPTVATHPASQSASLGGSVTFFVSANGTPPFGYQWLFNGQPLSSATNASLTLSNLDLSAAGTYTVSLSNAVGAAQSNPATLTVNSADSDGDGIPDSWEMNYFGSLSRNGAGDFDNDGMTDYQEWLAGTNPLDPQSALWLMATLANPGNVRVSFTAMASIGYTLQFKPAVVGGVWTNLLNIQPDPATRLVQITNSTSPGAMRFYRVGTPIQAQAIPVITSIELFTGSYSGGSYQLTGLGGSLAIYNLWATTNFIQWTPVGTVTGDVSGNFFFADTNAFQFPHRFYRASEW